MWVFLETQVYAQLLQGNHSWKESLLLVSREQAVRSVKAPVCRESEELEGKLGKQGEQESKSSANKDASNDCASRGNRCYEQRFSAPPGAAMIPLAGRKHFYLVRRFFGNLTNAK